MLCAQFAHFGLTLRTICAQFEHYSCTSPTQQSKSSSPKGLASLRLTVRRLELPAGRCLALPIGHLLSSRPQPARDNWAPKSPACLARCSWLLVASCGSLWLLVAEKSRAGGPQVGEHAGAPKQQRQRPPDAPVAAHWPKRSVKRWQLGQFFALKTFQPSAFQRAQLATVNSAKFEPHSAPHCPKLCPLFTATDKPWS